MKLSLNSAILGQSLSLPDYVALASKCGYEGVDLGLASLISLAPDDPVAAAEELFSRFDVAPAAWGLPVEWQQSDEDFEAGLASLPYQAEVAAGIGCPRCLAWIRPANEQPAVQYRAMVVPRLRKVAQTLGELGVRFGLEWVAPRHLRTEPGLHPFIWRMDQTLELIDEIAEPNLGLLVDSFHWFNAEHTIADLEALSPEQIVHVHINDAPDRSLDDQRDMEREVPGRGIIDLTGFLQGLSRTGYRDFLGVEILSEAFRQIPVEQAARDVYEATAEVIKQALFC